MLKTVLIICFSCICVGCSTFNSGEEWPSPVRPTVKPVEVIPVPEADIKDDGFYMDRTNAMHLADNVDELKAYAKKLEVQVEKMKKYYGAK